MCFGIQLPYIVAQQVIFQRLHVGKTFSTCKKTMI